MSTPTTTSERLDLHADARALYRAQVAFDRAVSDSPLDPRERAALALTDAVTLIATAPETIDPAYDAAAAHFPTEELAALLYAIAMINTWNRLAVATHAVFEP